MKGRKPTPTKILEARDSWRAKGTQRKNEPKPKVEELDCPSWLKGRAKAMWLKMSTQLFHIGILTSIDENALARYCRLWARWRDCEDFITKNGESFPILGRNGKATSYRLYPESRVASSLFSELRKLETEFGLTPSSRSRVDTDKCSAGPTLKSKARFFEHNTG